MAPKRWQHIEELCYAARERGSAVLVNVDAELRCEVQNLLAEDSGNGILNYPPET